MNAISLRCIAVLMMAIILNSCSTTDNPSSNNINDAISSSAENELHASSSSSPLGQSQGISNYDMSSSSMIMVSSSYISSSSNSKLSSSISQGVSSILSSSSKGSSSSKMNSSSSFLTVLSSSSFSSTALISSSSGCTTYGTNSITDCRDNNTYETVAIGTQVWMAENLNYDTLAGSGSWCYENFTTSCTKYGRLYTWSTAMAVSSDYNTSLYGASTSQKGICPDGWHLPSKADWMSLVDYVGGATVAGTKLKSTSDWTANSGATSDDAYGFSALPGGVYYPPTTFFTLMGNGGLWWTANDISSVMADKFQLGYSGNSSNISGLYKEDACSIRCIKN